MGGGGGGKKRKRETKRDDFRWLFHARGRVGIESAERNPRHCPLFIVFSSFITPCRSFRRPLFSRDRRKRAKQTRARPSPATFQAVTMTKNEDVSARFRSLIKSKVSITIENSVILYVRIYNRGKKHASLLWNRDTQIRNWTSHKQILNV
ncbi:hypothetical protein ALC62_10147 [Cyphomyrmex costatus]|uniref:Uncharacterized protein n=1 Tax=Cyphomyrmex costatus TaxID=456900 RepID=A0A195CGG7_9HYME|nr:hypothetical protein ALC62_10147 [Cyphomyrmex costatus]